MRIELMLRGYALALLIASCGGWAEGTSSSAITSGEATNAYPAVVALRMGAARCTGVVVSSTAVLTAAHCVSGLVGSEIEIVAGPSAEGPAIAKGRSLRVHPEYDRETLANDVAVVRTQPIDVVPLAWSAPLGREWESRSIRIVGYGRTGEGDRAPLVKREGTSVIDRVTDTEITLRGAPSRPCGGDSGGPALADLEDRYVVIALTSGGDEACRGIARDIRIDVHRAFIESAIEDGPSCSAAGGAPGGWLYLLLALLRRTLRRPEPDRRASHFSWNVHRASRRRASPAHFRFTP